MAIESDPAFLKLKEGHQIFVVKVLQGFNYTQAYLMANLPGCKNANKLSISKLASKTYNRPDIKALIDRETRLRGSRIEEAAAKTTENLHSLAFADVGDLWDDNGQMRAIKDLPTPLRQAITELEIEDGKVKVKFNGKLKAIEILGRMTNLVKEAPQVHFITTETRNARLKEIFESAAARPGPIVEDQKG